MIWFSSCIAKLQNFIANFSGSRVGCSHACKQSHPSLTDRLDKEQRQRGALNPDYNSRLSNTPTCFHSCATLSQMLRLVALVCLLVRSDVLPVNCQRLHLEGFPPLFICSDYQMTVQVVELLYVLCFIDFEIMCAAGK